MDLEVKEPPHRAACQSAQPPSSDIGKSLQKKNLIHASTGYFEHLRHLAQPAALQLA